MNLLSILVKIVQDSPVPELSATTITFNPCKP